MLTGVLCGVLAGALWGMVFLVPELLPGFSPVELAVGRVTVQHEEITARVVAVFKAKEAPKLQWYLVMKSWCVCML